MTRIKVHAFSDVGLVRQRNEDSVLVGGWLSQIRDGTLVSMDFAFAAPFVCAVADGMGGHAGGDVASRVALGAVAALSPRWNDAADIAETLAEVNDRVRTVGSDAGLRGLGTTVAGLCITTDAIFVFNVGDSRVYGITDGVLQQISVDDSVFDANGRPTNIITQSLGQGPPVRPHVQAFPLAPGSYLMCSDGVSGFMSDDELTAAIGRPGRLDGADQIIATTRGNGAEDNFTFVIVDVPDLTAGEADTVKARAVIPLGAGTD